MALDGGVTTAGLCGQLFCIQNVNMAAPDIDQTGVRKLTCRKTDRRALHAEHQAQEFLSERYIIALDEIAGVENPSRQTALQNMNGIAGRTLLSDRPHVHVVAVHGSPECL